jgi:hypothetical protein
LESHLCAGFASFGFIAFGVNIDSIAQKSMTDDNLASELSRLVWNDIVPLADNRAPYIVGHSKGANIAMHLAQSAAGCCLLDPVDFNVSAESSHQLLYASILDTLLQQSDSMSHSGSQTESIEGSSSVAEIVASLSSLPPVAIVGALNNRDIIDLSSSYRSFVAALPDCSCVEIEAGHLQFANDLPTLERYACASGPASDFEVQELSASIAVAHASQNDVRSVLTPNSHLCQR